MRAAHADNAQRLLLAASAIWDDVRVLDAIEVVCNPNSKADAVDAAKRQLSSSLNWCMRPDGADATASQAELGQFWDDLVKEVRSS